MWFPELNKLLEATSDNISVTAAICIGKSVIKPCARSK